MKYPSYEHEYSLSPRGEPPSSDSGHAGDEDFGTSTGAMVNLSPKELLAWDPGERFYPSTPGSLSVTEGILQWVVFKVCSLELCGDFQERCGLSCSFFDFRQSISPPQASVSSCIKQALCHLRTGCKENIIISHTENAEHTAKARAEAHFSWLPPAVHIPTFNLLASLGDRHFVVSVYHCPHFADGKLRLTDQVIPFFFFFQFCTELGFDPMNLVSWN